MFSGTNENMKNASHWLLSLFSPGWYRPVCCNARTIYSFEKTRSVFRLNACARLTKQNLLRLKAIFRPYGCYFQTLWFISFPVVYSFLGFLWKQRAEERFARKAPLKVYTNVKFYQQYCIFIKHWTVLIRSLVVLLERLLSKIHKPSHFFLVWIWFTEILMGMACSLSQKKNWNLNRLNYRILCTLHCVKNWNQF